MKIVRLPQILFMTFFRNLLLFIPLTLLSCSKTDKTTDPGQAYNTTEHESYRLYLWQHLFYNNWDFDFVGTNHDSFFYPGFDGLLFDRDHQGISGMRTQGVLNNMDILLKQSPTPDIVLLGIGGNDLVSGERTVEHTLDNISKIVRAFQQANPRVIVLIEQIAPVKNKPKFRGIHQKIKTFNQGIATITPTLCTSQSEVKAVDMHSNWSDSNFADDVHYSKKGAREVAKRYYLQILNHLGINRHYRILPLGDSRVAGLKLTNEHLPFVTE